MEHLKAEYAKWRETGHDITYEQWLEIVLDVERSNHTWMIDQYKALMEEQKGDSNVLRLRKLEAIAEISDVGLLFDGADHLNEFTHEENAKHMEKALDRINAITKSDFDMDDL